MKIYITLNENKPLTDIMKQVYNIIEAYNKGRTKEFIDF